MPRRVPRRIATISVHTSPLEQPGTGDAGGLNVYVVEVAKRLAPAVWRSRSSPGPSRQTHRPWLNSCPACWSGTCRRPVRGAGQGGPARPAVPVHVRGAARGGRARPGRYDLVHAHYWLSGQVGLVARQRWGVPLVQSMHTLGRVKNAALARGDAAEPEMRLRGETEVVSTADRLVANTEEEALQLVGLYGADPAKVWTVNPGVDLAVFRPGPAAEARRRLGLPAERDRSGVRGPGAAAEGTRPGAPRRRAAGPGRPGAGQDADPGVRRRPERDRAG